MSKWIPLVRLVPVLMWPEHSQWRSSREEATTWRRKSFYPPFQVCSMIVPAPGLWWNAVLVIWLHQPSSSVSGHDHCQFWIFSQWTVDQMLDALCMWALHHNPLWTYSVLAWVSLWHRNEKDPDNPAGCMSWAMDARLPWWRWRSLQRYQVISAVSGLMSAFASLAMLHRSSFMLFIYNRGWTDLRKVSRCWLMWTPGKQLPVAEGLPIWAVLFVWHWLGWRNRSTLQCVVSTWVTLGGSTCLSLPVRLIDKDGGTPESKWRLNTHAVGDFSSKAPPTAFLIMSLFRCIPKPCIKTFFCLKVWLCSGLAPYSMPCELNLHYPFNFRQINSS